MSIVWEEAVDSVRKRRIIKLRLENRGKTRESIKLMSNVCAVFQIDAQFDLPGCILANGGLNGGEINRKCNFVLLHIPYLCPGSSNISALWRLVASHIDTEFTL